MNGKDAGRPSEEELFEHLFAPSTEQPPSADQLRRWADRFGAELHAARRRRNRNRFAIAAAACAAALALTVAVTTRAPPPAAGAVVAHVVTAFGGNVVRDGGEVREVLASGAVVHAGALVESGLRSGLGVLYRGADVRLDAGTRVVFHHDRLELREGRLYLDLPRPNGSADAARMLVDTPQGAFGHLGTQFVVSVTRREVSGAVREGAIVWRRGGQEVRLDATGGQARRVMIDGAGKIVESAVPSSGPLWAWALRTSPGIDLSGRSPQDVLEWSARERGQRLVYASAAAERLARSSRFSGGAAAMSVDEALATVAGTTGLEIETSDDGALVARLNSERDQNAQ